MAERTDTVVRRVDDGGHDYGDGTATAASAMAEGSEGERWGEWTSPGGLVRDVEVVQASSAAREGSRAAGSCVARAGAGVEQLPACLAKPSSSLERWLGWAGRWACWVAPGKLSLSLFPVCFLFLFFCNFRALLKILRQLLKS